MKRCLIRGAWKILRKHPQLKLTRKAKRIKAIKKALTQIERNTVTSISRQRLSTVKCHPVCKLTTLHIVFDRSTRWQRKQLQMQNIGSFSSTQSLKAIQYVKTETDQQTIIRSSSILWLFHYQLKGVVSKSF